MFSGNLRNFWCPGIFFLGCVTNHASISKKIVEVWVQNQKNKVKPWVGPLPSPRRSLLRTLGDVLANAKYVDRSFV
jgi:hypothetical protein